MPTLHRRPVMLALGFVLAAGLLPMTVTATTATVASTSLASAEKTALDLMNTRRANAGLVNLRNDSRVAALARQRAEYMAATDKLSHTHAGGASVFDMMTAAGIKWYGVGEIIAWNTSSGLNDSAASAIKQWMASAGHKAILLSKSYNYVGFGVAISASGRRYWAGVFLKGPDRTGAWTRMTSVSKTSVDARRVKITVRWTGADTKLQVLTSGFRYYQVQKSVDGAAWYDYGTRTTPSLSRTWSRGHTVVVRVRARDKAGNWGSWKSVTVKT
jgi:uncharacterized protein YkwD